MRTENDLRDAILARADAAPAARPDLLVVRPAERHPRRRMGIAVATAAVAVAAVAVVPSLLRDDHGTSGAVPGGTTPATVSSAAGPKVRTTPPPALLAARTWISYSGTDAVDAFDTVQAQYFELRTGTDGFQVREITAFAPGLFHPSLIKHPQPITVNGVKGYFGAILPWRNDDVSHTDPAHTDPRGSKYAEPMPAVLWKIGPDQWAAVISNIPSEGNAAALTAIAADVHAASDAVRTPIKVGYLPAGYQLSDVDHSRNAAEAAGPSSELGFRRNTKYDYFDWRISVTKVAKPNTTGGPSTPGLGTVHSIYPVLHRTVGQYVITVDTAGAISKAQGERVLASVTLAGQPGAPNDSWFTLAQALP